ncbi:ATP-binding protein [Rickettsia endosymbiont of Gonocerus acuteangulatus]|uniref:ATP-binding protein n=1 Tax=Rickettsia endosymbiont of Gonocerus acuteangulatus TaxID=3066266 RepID=UPI00397CB78A
MTTNKDFEKWNEIFADEVLTHAIIDRVVHHAHILNIKGKSYRINNYKSGGNMA